jgi:hypothetical protein
MKRATALLLLTAALLTSCAPSAKRPTQQFSATTSLQENRVVVTVRNLGPEDVWLDPNHCPPAFRVETAERLPSIRSSPDGGSYIFGDFCYAIELPPELWKVGETRSGLLANTRLPPGTYPVTAWAEPLVAPDIGGAPSGRFQTARVQASTAVLKVP